MCHTLIRLHSKCPHVHATETIPCVTAPILGKCILLGSQPQTKTVKGDVPYCLACYEGRAEVQIWAAVQEAEARREIEGRYASETRIEREVEEWYGGFTARLLGWLW